ncbi:uncharacterized protein FOMMEDRAFT_145291 [Fomitiporia mediterranea MF3/22]|uniref:uncharacterized protein n=1 Tax=Fomitiporia mediterranea (strain MF3/22) TaxID=694068 RepID=UPI0004408776|nr:uncharacterized protein FOMMEDRAFT_145291 [Fomitiporia mediterranea MF3/22]EJD05945.1 hypothetical protein FOMMEDRAFT_145291 [Fomitiporia mediterranea MF3/22]
MSITPELRASARATYRFLFRTAANTFRGDDRVLNAFREKVRNDFREGRSVSEESVYSARIQLGREVADVLRKNVVQGVKVQPIEQSSTISTGVGDKVKVEEGGVWRLRITKDTELGSNETTKMGSASTSPGGLGRGQTCCQQQSSTSASSPFESPTPTLTSGSNDTNSNSQRKMNYTTLKRLSQTRTKPELNEADLEESFVRGSGPGGQSINKTSNNVQLLHKPTGIRVTCQETRSLQTNRMIARRNLIEKLDQIANPGLSKENLKRAKQVERERRRRKKAKKKKDKAHSTEADEDEEA